MAVCLLWAGFSFFIDNGQPTVPTQVAGEEPTVSNAQLGSIAAAIYLFMACYSPSEGPVPFTCTFEEKRRRLVGNY